MLKYEDLIKTKYYLIESIDILLYGYGIGKKSRKKILKYVKKCAKKQKE